MRDLSFFSLFLQRFSSSSRRKYEGGQNVLLRKCLSLNIFSIRDYKFGIYLLGNDNIQMNLLYKICVQVSNHRTKNEEIINGKLHFLCSERNGKIAIHFTELAEFLKEITRKRPTYPKAQTYPFGISS